MEFFETANIKTDESTIHQRLTVGALADYCASVEEVYETDGDNAGRGFMVWGDFRIERQLIKGGARFSLPECPNMLAWTVTTGYPPAEDKVVIHCTIARKEQDPDFVESLEDFMADWKKGLEANW
ncbi:MAG: hypothetical protein D6677_06575 [Calditrichaeota bacterium]|nr:MAG: hypothetical protein D6677_06575 [Calditrichota bacterium]